MLILDFYNSTRRPAFAVLRGLLGCVLSPSYRNGFALALDPIETRAARTRGAAVVEVELHEDGSGVEVAAFGWWLLVGVELRRDPLPATENRYANGKVSAASELVDERQQQGGDSSY